MGNAGACLMQPLAFAFRQMNAMGKNPVVIDQAKPLVNRRVIAFIGKQRFHHGNFASTLGKMRLHQGIRIGFEQLTRHFQLGFGGGNRKTW